MEGEDSPVNDGETQTIGRWEYYEILGVDKNVTLEELRKKRKRLALRYHPDKNQGDDTAQHKMQQVNRAFDVLSDPMKKKLYDRYGVEALTMYENNTITEDMWNVLFLFVNQRFTAFVGCMCFTVFSIVLLAPIFIGLKLDDRITWSWFAVLSPLFFIEFFIFLLDLLVVLLGIYFRENEHTDQSDNSDSFLQEDEKQKIPIKKVISSSLSLLVILLVVLFQLLLCLQLDETVSWSWWIIFAPVLLAQILFVVFQYPAASYSSYQERQSPIDPFYKFYCRLQYPGFLLRSFYKEIIVFVFTVLVAMNLAYAPNSDDVLGEDSGVSGYISWWYITIPMFALVVIAMILSIIENCWYSKLKRKDYVPLDDEENEGEEEPSLFSQLGYICCTCLCVSFLGVFFILLAGWLQADFGFSAMTMLSPLILVASLICCACVCCVFPIYAYVVQKYSKGDEFELPVHKEEATS